MAQLELATQVAVAIVRRGHEVLVGIRPSDVPLAGLAEFPGGKCAPHETPEAAAVRECLEETGLRVQPLRRLCEVDHTYPHGRVQLTFIECSLSSETPPRPPFRWVPIAHLPHYPFPEANAPVLALLQSDNFPGHDLPGS